MRTLVLAACVALLASCGGGAGVPPVATPTTSTATSTVATRTTQSASPTVAPTPITSAKGGITVRVPLANSRITSPVTFSGEASVFEAALLWRVVDAGGRVFAEGSTTASAGAPARGTFTVTATFTPPSADTIGAVEVFDRSPKDGQIDELVRVPVVISR